MFIIVDTWQETVGSYLKNEFREGPISQITVNGRKDPETRRISIYQILDCEPVTIHTDGRLGVSGNKSDVLKGFRLEVGESYIVIIDDGDIPVIDAIKRAKSPDEYEVDVGRSRYYLQSVARS
jgi:hypothetical protein